MVMRFVLAMLLAAPAAADMLILEPDRDNTLFESPTGSLSSASGPHLFTGRTATGEIRRALLHFDLTSILPGSTVNSVTLKLRMNMTRAGSIACTLHRVEADWGNGTSGAGSSGGGGGAAATTNDPTWLHRFFNTASWSLPGGDFDPTALASVNVGNIGTYTWASNAALVAAVQSWVDSPATNFGWMLRGGEASNQTAKRFESDEISTMANRPQLTVDFTPISPVDPATWSGIKQLYRD